MRDLADYFRPSVVSTHREPRGRKGHVPSAFLAIIPGPTKRASFRPFLRIFNSAKREMTAL
jgi:hypothetical protein